MRYTEWNDRIVTYFFNERMARREVLLYATKDVIEDIGHQDGVGVEDFVQAVKVGPANSLPGNVCKNAYALFKSWTRRPSGYPPYLAYLALFVYAATTFDTTFDKKSYYPKLCKVLGEPIQTGSYLHFKKMVDLWGGVETWANIDENKELGKFTRRTRGGWVHVGIPLSQLILSERERKALPRIFDEVGLDASSLLSPEKLRQVLLSYQGDVLSAPTKKILKTGDRTNPTLLEELLQLVLEELREWRGTLPPERDDAHTRKERVKRKTIAGRESQRICGEVLICLEDLHKALGEVSSYLRIRTTKRIPEDGLRFKHDGSILTCQEANVEGWTYRLKVAGSQPSSAIASSFDWKKGAVLEDEGKHWAARLKAGSIRVFVSGSSESLRGWVEGGLSYNTEFLIACHRDCEAIVERWGQHCEQMDKLNVTGLPDQWVLFEGKNATNSCTGIDALTLPSKLNLRLEGGIRIGPGSEYLGLAPPSIRLEQASGTERVTLDGRTLVPDPVIGCCWSIPCDVPIDRAIEVAVYDSYTKVASKKFTLRDPFVSDSCDDCVGVDKFGHIPDETKNGSSLPGSARARGAEVLLAARKGAADLPLHLSHRITFIGRKPGNIVNWPVQSLPVTWWPVWALAKYRKGAWEVHYCGLGLVSDRPFHELQKNRQVKKWKKAIWGNRRKNLGPKSGYAAELWEKYMEVASGV